MARNYRIGSHSSTFEFGVKVRNGHKGQDAESPVYDQAQLLNPPATPLMSQFLGPFVNNNYYGGYRFGPVTDFGKITAALSILPKPGILPLDEPATRESSDPNNYDLTERISAGYLMNTVQFGRFHLQTGFRLEATQLNVLGYHVTNDANGNWVSTSPVQSAAYYISPLPSVQLRYALSDDSDIRAVYGRGISRPDPYDLVPYILEDRSAILSTFGIGNPNLQPEHANDYDLLFEHYLETIWRNSGWIFLQGPERSHRRRKQSVGHFRTLHRLPTEPDHQCWKRSPGRSRGILYSTSWLSPRPTQRTGNFGELQLYKFSS